MLSLPEDAQPHLRRFASVFSQGGDKTPDEEEEEEEEDVVQDVTHRGGSLSAGLAERVEFVEMMPREQHLERAALTDAFLDTLLVNAHTTAMDMTWAGVPVVTRPHVRFSSRVAARPKKKQKKKKQKKGNDMTSG
ncbi:glycosyl transferase family 41-domain-containing protein [Baffinella frigidus]|nr:glycosyl transferase family 41-domain-containing protein [Cryptophyta sp. CCMP2293]